MFKIGQTTRASATARRVLSSGIAGLIAGFSLFLVQSAALPPVASAGENLDTVRAANAAIRKHENNIAKMRAELAANPRDPDASKLRDVLATAGGQRSQTFNNLNPALQTLINNFERSAEKNVGGSVVMGLGGASARTQYIIEIARSTQLVDAMKELRSTLLEKAQQEAYQERMDRLAEPTDPVTDSAPATPSSTGPSGITTSSRLPRPDRLPGWGNSDWRNPGWGSTRTASNSPGRNPAWGNNAGARTPNGSGSGGACHRNPTTGAQHCQSNTASKPTRSPRDASNASRQPRAYANVNRGIGRQPQARATRVASRSVARQPQVRAARFASSGRNFGRRR